MIQSNHEIHYSAGKFNHSPTITPIPSKPKETLVAFYSGQAECHESQRVVILWNQNGQIRWQVELEPFTGNPVLFNGKDGPSIIYSKFEKFPVRKSEWWQWCSLWQRKITFRDNTFTCSQPVQIKVSEEYRIPPAPASGLGYVGRCNPIYHPDFGYLLPLYRERHPEYHGVVLQSPDGYDWKYHSTIGFHEENATIQPSLWYEEYAGKFLIRSYSRNFNPALRKTNKPLVLSSACQLDSKNWLSVQYDSMYTNFNNSIATLPKASGGPPIVVWNNDSTGRQNLTLGYLGEPIIVLDTYGSYPSIVYENHMIHVVYTAKPSPYRLGGHECYNVIKYKQFDANSIVKYAKEIEKQKYPRNV